MEEEERFRGGAGRSEAEGGRGVDRVGEGGGSDDGWKGEERGVRGRETGEGVGLASFLAEGERERREVGLRESYG